MSKSKDDRGQLRLKSLPKEAWAFKDGETHTCVISLHSLVYSVTWMEGGGCNVLQAQILPPTCKSGPGHSEAEGQSWEKGTNTAPAGAQS